MRIKYMHFGAFLLIICLIICCFFSMIQASGNTGVWKIQPGPTVNIKIPATQRQFMRINNQLQMVALEDGRLGIYTYNENGTWEKMQTLEPSDATINTLQVSDLDNDNCPEIITGSLEPGFIHVYHWDDTDKWVVDNSNKYVWSTVTKIMVGRFSGTSERNIVVQNSTGYLYLFKFNDTSLDLLWKSPTPWKMIETEFSTDLDKDLREELVVVYKNDGIAALKVTGNTIGSVWKSFPWGKILSINYFDWNNNNRPDLIVTTAQKILYRYENRNKKLYAGKQEKLTYGIENMYFIQNAKNKYLLTTDTTGKTHISEYFSTAKGWQEKTSFSTGRILQLFETTPNHFLLINQSLQIFTLGYGE